ncbi:MAG: hypothetical protein AUI10_05230 [Actinobacteria bacterium 13_2_20CM_2_72_6]|nr:MAG: hypothetical protein AUI10_05230 [Actinobacteria bacterium 13_2_20CM_2_72_6]
MLQLPATFALRNPTATRGGASSRDGALLAIGMTLPDGGALTVDWRTGRAGTVGVWSSPQAAAGAHRADLVWYGHGTVPVAGPPNAGLWRTA